MEKLLIDAKNQREKLIKTLKELDIVIEYLEKNIKAGKTSTVEPKKTIKKKGSKFAKVGALCVELIKKEHNITSSSQFMKYINGKEINISPAGLAIALKQAGLVFNKEKKLWELTK